MRDFYGPWSFELSTLEVHDKDGDLVVDVDSGDFMKGKSAELGQLIAAAPELLSALQGVVNRWTFGPAYNAPEFVAARAVISKALGEKP